MIPNIYQGNYKILLIPSILLILVSIYFIPQIHLGVDFKGGTLVTLTLKDKIDKDQLKANLQKVGINANVRVFDTTLGSKAEIEVEQSDQLVMADNLKASFNNLVKTVELLEANASNNSAALPAYLEKRKELNNISDTLFVLAALNKKSGDIGNLNELQKTMENAYNQVYANYRESISKPIQQTVGYTSISVQSVSPALSTTFIQKATGVVIFSSALSVFFVFLFFRKLVPAATVLIGAASDVTIAMGAMGLFGIALTLPSFAALLMLVGFSLDTDILSAKRILGRPGDNREKTFDAFKTGTTMSIAAIIAFGVLFLIANATHISTYFDISAVALAGIIGDMFTTWGINAVLLLWYAENKDKSK